MLNVIFILQQLNLEDDSVETDEGDSRIELPSNWSSNIPDYLVHAINSCLREIVKVYKYADQLLAQPHRFVFNCNSNRTVKLHTLKHLRE